jgi:uncharacterized protein YgiM (DUF1202 family)
VRIRWRNAFLFLVVLGAVAAGAWFLSEGGGVWDRAGQILGVSIRAGEAKGTTAAGAPAVDVTVIPVDQPLLAEGISWFVTPQMTATPQPTISITVRKHVATVHAGVLNLRAGPSTDHGIVGQAERGGKFEIVGRNGAGDWLQIVAPDGTEAWVYGQLVTTDADLGSLPVTDVSSAPPPTE